MRGKEDRVRFSGYSVANFKIFIFCVAATLSGVGGAMFTLQFGFMSPSFVGIVPSIEMVIFAAVGGRLSLLGAVYGALLVNWAKTAFSEAFPELWLFAMGGAVHRRGDGLPQRPRRSLCKLRRTGVSSHTGVGTECPRRTGFGARASAFRCQIGGLR